MEKIITVILTNLVTNLLFIPCLSLLRKLKQESNFQQDGRLIKKDYNENTLWFRGMANSIYFHKGIFLYFIPARLIASYIYKLF